ncbi:MAG TPA: N-acetylmuramoyl-L-alanine amidase [Acidimicrobiia bacterium]|nr:N-acetylmuramoyl-L-alanine amidase [Acidimicrobiia bacterium]
MHRLTRRQFIGAAAAGLAVAGGMPAPPARGLSINPRESWGADLQPVGPLSSEDVKFLIVHHSASHNGHDPADVPGILRGWFEFHTTGRGWNDIAYNFVIDSAGGIWEGRQGSIDGPVAGDATGGNQGFTQLVCLIGDTNAVAPTAAAQSALVGVLAWLADRYGVSTAPGVEVTFTSRGSNRWAAGTEVTTPTIAGHRDMSQTSCPGDHLYSYVTGSLRADVEATRAGGSPPATAAPNTTTTTTSTTSTTTTTTTPATTTTVPPTTTTIPASTTTIPAPTTIPPTTTAAPGNTTLPVAVESPGAIVSPGGVLATATGLILGGAGLLVWRYRRMVEARTGQGAEDSGTEKGRK